MAWATGWKARNAILQKRDICGDELRQTANRGFIEMRFRTVIAIMLACGATGFAQEHMADTLRNGILEEDSKQNPRAAIQQYQAVMTQFAEARQTAATALFRIAECYRKQGNRVQAIAAYQRVLKDFGDQTKLAGQSRTLLATTYNVTPGAMPSGTPPTAGKSDRAKFDQLMQGQDQELEKIKEARSRYRDTIEEEMAVDEKQLALVRESHYPPFGEITALEEKIIRLKRDLAAFDAGMPLPTAR
jgi:tetratricopeptide (TPR) repeat protein